MNGIRTASMVGLGRLGAPIAACFASRGFDVVGYDPNPERVLAVNERRPFAFEPGLEALYGDVGERLRATDHIEEAVLASNVTFLVVPTPSGDDGSFSLDQVLPTVRSVGEAIRKKSGYHLVVLTSTVMPGSTERRVLPALEKASGRTVGDSLGLCYSAVFVTMGHIIEDFLAPDWALIGECDVKSGDALEAIYHRVCVNAPPVVRMNPFNAELAKVAINVFVTTKISFANVLARICEQMPGGNVDVVTGAMQFDPRIGHGALRGAIAYGGPFFAKDSRAFGTMMRRLGIAPELLSAMGRFNRDQMPWLADRVHQMVRDGDSVAVLGLSYKPDTDLVQESPSIYLCRHLADQGVPVVAHDPAAMDAARRALPPAILFAETAEACIAKGDLVVLATPWRVYRDLPAAAWSREGEPRAVVDCWRAVPHLADQAGVAYVSLGTGPGTPADAGPMTTHPHRGGPSCGGG